MTILLTDEELKVALDYSHEHTQYLRMLREEQAQLKISLRFTPATPLEFAQEEATIHAKISLLDDLISANMNPNTKLSEI